MIKNIFISENNELKTAIVGSNSFDFRHKLL